jgi:hypothetical protein
MRAIDRILAYGTKAYVKSLGKQWTPKLQRYYDKKYTARIPEGENHLPIDRPKRYYVATHFYLDQDDIEVSMNSTAQKSKVLARTDAIQRAKRKQSPKYESPIRTTFEIIRDYGEGEQVELIEKEITKAEIKKTKERQTSKIIEKQAAEIRKLKEEVASLKRNLQYIVKRKK